jgi:hypothetical protein
MPRDKVFMSYSHKDKRWRDDLYTHLKPYLREGSITSWPEVLLAAKTCANLFAAREEYRLPGNSPQRLQHRLDS